MSWWDFVGKLFGFHKYSDLQSLKAEVVCNLTSIRISYIANNMEIYVEYNVEAQLKQIN